MSIYLTAILPPSSLSEEISEIREEISGKFKVYKALKPPVHITLFRPVHLEEEREKHLIRLLKPVSMQHRPFEQSLENFDSFNNQTLYIRVAKTPLLQALQKDIAGVFNKNKIDPREVKGNTSFSPHITIAYRDIPPNVFPVLWNEYKNRKFRRNFSIEKFSLLKHDGEQWNLLEEYPLQKPTDLQLF